MLTRAQKFPAITPNPVHTATIHYPLYSKSYEQRMAEEDFEHN